MDDLAVATLPELARGGDFIVRAHGDLVIREPRTTRARNKLVAERALREALAPRFPSLVAEVVACDLPAPLFAYRYVRGTPITPPPSARFVAELASFVDRLHAMTDLPMTVDPTPSEVVRRLQTVVRERYLPKLAASERDRFVLATDRAVPAVGIVACPQHGDLATRNLLVGDHGELAAVLDWSDTVISDPAIDFGAIAEWGGADVLDEVLVRTARANDRALRERAMIVGELLSAIERVHEAA